MRNNFPRSASRWLGFADNRLQAGHRMQAAKGVCGALSCLTALKEEDPNNPDILPLAERALQLAQKIHQKPSDSFQQRINDMDFPSRLEKLGVAA